MRTLLLAMLLLPALVQAQAPAKLGYQGLLLKADGTPETGVVTVQFALFDSAAGGSALWQETQQLALSDGLYSTFLGEVTPLPVSAFDGTERFLELTVAGAILSPRQRVNSVAYSLRAASARDVSGGTVDATSIKVGGVSVIDPTGKLAGPAAYGAGTGLTLSGTTFSLPTGCASGEVLRWDGTAWQCSPAVASGYQPGAGLALSGTTFSLDASGCTASGQVLKWDGAGWACENDSGNSGTVTQVSTGLGLVGGPFSSTGTIDLRLGASSGLSKTLGAGSNELGIAPGGVSNSMLANGSVSVSAGTGLSGGGPVALGGSVTLSNAGVLTVAATAPLFSSGGQNPTLSMGVVGIANGGTGTTTAPTGAGQFLRSAGASSWGVGGIQASDLPSLSGSYVDLTSSQTVDGAKTFSSPISGSVTGSAASITGTLAGDVTGAQGATVVEALRGRPVSSASPSGGQVLAWNGSAWAPAPSGGTGTVTQVNSGTGLTGGPFSSSGTLAIDPAVVPQLGVANTFTAGAQRIQTGGAVTKGLLVQGAASQSANLQEWLASSGAVLASVGPTGIFSGALNGNAGTASQLAANGANCAAGSASLGVSASGAAEGCFDVASQVELDAHETLTDAHSASAANTPGAIVMRNSSGDFVAGVIYGTLSGNATSATTAANFSGSLSGDVTGTQAATVVGGLQGRAVSSTAPSDGQHLRWSGTAWTPAAVALTTDVSGLLPLGNGGTGSGTALGARTALGAAASGANADITSLTGLTTPLHAIYGGLGLNTASALRGEMLRRNGAGNAWEVLAVGSAGQVLKVSGGTPTWQPELATTSLRQVPRTNTLTAVDVRSGSTSITIGTDGFPVISSYATTTFDLKVTKCGNADCSAGNTVTVLDSGGFVGFTCSIAIGADGLPAISYWDQTNGDLKMAKCGNAACSAGNTLTVVDDVGDVGAYTSITIGTDGLPVISYLDTTNGRLKVAKCGNADCSAGNTLTTVDSSANVGYSSSIAIGLDGLPVISYRDNGLQNLKVAKCGDPACSAGITLTAVDSVGNVGSYGSIAIGADGLPVISYYDSGNGYLKVAKCGDAACSAGNTVTTVDSATNVGRDTAITIGTDGLPLISYYDVTNMDLKVAKCGNAACSAGNTLITVESAGVVGQQTSITIGVDSLPVISYADPSNSVLKVARCANSFCLDNWVRR